MACERDHDRLKRDSEQWQNLALVGVQSAFVPGEPDLELRNCTCGSTLAKVVPARAPDRR